MMEPIAILGIGCRYPEAESIDAFWQLLMDGRDVIVPYPGGRFSELDQEYAVAAAGKPTKVATHLGGFLPDVDRFDAAFFGISPREAVYVDPQQRMLLEVSLRALEDAGQVREKYEGSRTGVYVGIWTSEHEQLTHKFLPKPEFYMLTGGGRSTACGRISFTFGFEGPSVAVDTACSSSMVAIHMACQALREGQCDMALGGGANVILSTDQTRVFTHAKMLAPDGHCKFGDEAANGFVRSEGASVVVLKRLSDAVAAGDPIYAVILGSSVNSDGRSGGLMVTPSREGQKNMLLQAWREAGVTADKIGYIEAHGTGTQAGDPVELGAIGDALIEMGAVAKVPVGSLKTNIGHTESAAGVAGVIKAAMVLEEGVIPPMLLKGKQNPKIDWEGAPIELALEARELACWKDGEPRYVGASSFGLIGTNAHMLLGEHLAGAEVKATGDSGLGGLLLPISSYSADGLKLNARRWAEFLASGLDEVDVAEICYLAGARRSPLAHRFAAVGCNAVELKQQMEAMVAGEASASPEAGLAAEVRAKVVFVAPGQGSQWDGMARELYRDHAGFREAFAACSRVIEAETGWSLIERLVRLESAEAIEYLKQIDFVQPALWAMSVALAAVWRAAGVEPGVVVGHSMGEAAAAYLSGALSLEDAAAVICRRSRLMRRLAGSGAMASVEMPAAELAEALEQFEGRVSIAAENAPGTTVVAGEADAVDRLLEWLELKEVFCRRIKVDVASHSVMVDPILDELRESLEGLKPQKAVVPFFSTVEGRYLDGTELNADYWVRNLRQPVRLATATGALLADGFGAFVELSPHAIVVPTLENTLRAKNARDAVALPSLVRGGEAGAALLRSMGRLWIAGGRLDWAALTGRADGPVSRRFRLPEYVFERERFWLSEGEAVAAGASKLSTFLRSRVELGQDQGTWVFNVIADTKSLPYLGDHRVGGAQVFPASGHLEVVLEAARELWPEAKVELRNVAFLQALYVAEDSSGEVQLAIRRVAGVEKRFSFTLLGRTGPGSEASWGEYSQGLIVLDAVESEKTFAAPDFAGEDLAERVVGKESFYRVAKQSGLEYGPVFQRVEEAVSKRIDGVLMAQVIVAPAEDAGDYLLHPAMLDACFQTMLLLRSRIPGLLPDDVYLPSEIGSMRVHALWSSLAEEETKTLLAEAVFRRADVARRELWLDLRLKTERGTVLASFDGFKVTWAEARSTARRTEDVHELGWKPMRVAQELMPGGAMGRHCLILSDGGADGAADGRAAEFARQLTSQGGRCTLVWEAEGFRALGDGERRLDLLGADEYELSPEDEGSLGQLLGLVAAEAGRISDVLDFWTVAKDVELEAIWAAQARGTKFVPTLIQGITRAQWTHPPRLWMVTVGTQQVAEAPGRIELAGATVWGIGAVAIHEHGELRPCIVDMSADAYAAEAKTLLKLVLEEKAAAERENRLALRGEAAYCQRVMPLALAARAEEARVLQAGERYHVEPGKVKALDQLHLRVVSQTAAKADEVVVAIGFGGMNFIDTLRALGLHPGLAESAVGNLGGEASGRVVAVGEGVTRVQVGDEVVAITPSFTHVGLLASHAVVPERLVVKLPATLTLEEAGAQPLAYFTAYLGLEELARLEKDEWVLIHAGAGGVGLAAVQVAQAVGAKVIATASSPEKHAFLHGWGVEHVLNSRSLDFAEGVMEITQGRGVDVVLNSLSGEFIDRSMEVLAAYGRFVELGKRDIYADKRVGLKAFRKNISYFAVDMAAMFEERPERSTRLFHEVMAKLAEGKWKPLPTKSYAAGEVSEAFRVMAQGKHIGKLAVDFTAPAAETLVHPEHTNEGSLSEPHFKSDGTYLITGGLGGVALEVGQWLARAGAGCIVLVSRREAGGAETAAIERMRAHGARVEHLRSDLTDRAQVEELIAAIGAGMPRLRGIIHGAAVIDDALMTDLRPERFDAVFAPKMRGVWYLHEATLGLPLEFFVMFSSVATIFPQPGQGSYSAANAFLDSFAMYRRSLGLVASSICWIGWVNMGLAKHAGTGRTIATYGVEGLGSFDGPEATGALWQALWANPVHATATRLDEEVIGARDHVPTLLRDVVGGAAAQAGKDAGHAALERLKAAGRPADRVALVEELIRGEAGRVLKLAPEKIAVNQAFGQLGVDSLMALELVRRINALLGLALPATAVFNYPTVTLLGAQLLGRLGLDSVEKSAVPQVASAPIVAEAEELSEEDALRALMEPGDGSSGD